MGKIEKMRKLRKKCMKEICEKSKRNRHKRNFDSSSFKIPDCRNILNLIINEVLDKINWFIRQYSKNINSEKVQNQDKTVEM